MFSIFVYVGLFLVFYIWQWYHYNYWTRKNVESPKALPLVGNLMEVLQMKKTLGMKLDDLYRAPGCENAPVVGGYLLVRPALVVRDLDLIKKILIKDFNNFVNRAGGSDPHHDPLGHNNLFFVPSSLWRNIRNKLSPVFTSGKIKQMYPLMIEVAKELDEVIEAKPNNEIVEFRELCGRFTSQLISTIAFGVNCNSVKDPKSDFFKYSRAIFEVTKSRAFDFIVAFAAPQLASIFRTKVFSNATSEFMRRSIRHVVAEREKSGMLRNDMIDVLVEMKREAAADATNSHPARNFDFLVAQASVFQSAGFETSSSTMSFALYELAKAPQIQDKLREEIGDAFSENGSWISYERIHEMKFLSMVVDETLRKYPVLPFLDRQCAKPFMLTDNLQLDSGTAIYISVLSLHYDEKYWPEPDKFDPYRFDAENRDKLCKDAYMPFGIGPRNCIGMRLGLLQSKLGLVHLLRNHRVVRCEDTPDRIEFETKTALLSPVGGIKLKLQKV